MLSTTGLYRYIDQHSRSSPTSLPGHTGTYTHGDDSNSVTHLKVLKVFNQIMILAEGQSCYCQTGGSSAGE